MIVATSAAKVQPVRNPYFQDAERRGEVRHAVALEATSYPMEPNETLSWGAVVNDISPGGLSVTICYPFRAGTYLAIEMQHPNDVIRTIIVRVVHAQDQSDGMWRLGCEFLKPMTQSDMEVYI